MIFWTSYLNRLCLLATLLLVLGGCLHDPEGPEPLRLDSVAITSLGPPRAKLGGVRWQALTRGGQAPLRYQLQARSRDVVSEVVTGSKARGRWRINKPGRYEFRILVQDAAGQQVQGDWSGSFQFRPALDRNQVYAVLPPVNLSNNEAPLEDIRRAWSKELTARGLRIIDHRRLEEFMRTQRMRHVGGIDTDLSEAFKSAGVDGVFITALESWSDRQQPRISVISRLVLTGDHPEILWMNGIGLTGDDETGLLAIGRIDSAAKLLDKGLGQLGRSLEDYFAGTSPVVFHDMRTGPKLIHRWTPQQDGSPDTVKRRFRPDTVYRASDFVPGRHYNVAIVPFLNINARKYSGEILPLHLLQALLPYANLRLIEPGVVRDRLLNYRMVMQSGPSLAAADVLADPLILGADLIISGKVFDYQDAIGESKVDFSLQAFDGPRRTVIWGSRSTAAGREGVYLFDWGAVPSAHHLTRNMVYSVARMLEADD